MSKDLMLVVKRETGLFTLLKSNAMAREARNAGKNVEKDAK